ncbi:MAG: hypothetical protein OJF55_000890 [Rhodanobacteraceae bacterium]|nr:MAG: hypothetical protein OJF55_000890 [Rhodanobacteraceae bacterium]
MLYEFFPCCLIGCSCGPTEKGNDIDVTWGPAALHFNIFNKASINPLISANSELSQ